jgi:hypothetical protein
MRRYVTLAVAVLVPASVGAGWSSDPAVNTPIVTQTAVSVDRSYPMLARDVTGNLLVVWQQTELVPPFSHSNEAYAVLIGNDGDVVWAPEHLARIWSAPPVAAGTAVLTGVGTAIGLSEALGLVTSPPARLIRVWRLAPDGTWLSATFVTEGFGGQTDGSLAAVGQGVVAAWMEGSTAPAIKAQRVGPGGQREWGVPGRSVCANAAGSRNPIVVPDDADGAIVVWTLATVLPQLYAQRLGPDGTPSWAEGGIPVAPGAGTPTAPVAVADGAGGVVVVWLDDRSGTPEVYAQRLDGTGAPLWAPGGVRVVTAPGVESPRLVALGGGAVVAWTDRRNGHVDVFAQRLSAAGALQWPADGLPVTAAPGDQTLPILLADGVGGVVLAWQDHRGATWDVYAQRLNPDGSNAWTDSGRPVSIAARDQTQVAGLADGAGGAYFVWRDERTASQPAALYGAHVHATGVLPVTLRGFAVE